MYKKLLIISIVLLSIFSFNFLSFANNAENIEAEYTGFAYDEEGNKTKDIKVLINSRDSDEKGIIDINADIICDNESWNFVSESYIDLKNTRFISGYYKSKESLTDKERNEKDAEGEMAIYLDDKNNITCISGTINNIDNLQFVAGNDAPSERTVKKNTAKLKKKANRPSKDTTAATDPNIRGYENGSDIVIQVVGKEKIKIGAKSWYAIRSWMKQEWNTSLYSVRYQNNFITPENGTGCLSTVDLDPKTEQTPWSVTVGYANYGNITYNFHTGPETYLTHFGQSYVKNYYAPGYSKNKYKWPGSWSSDNSGLGAKFQMEMDGGNDPGDKFSAKAKTIWKIYDFSTHMYTSYIRSLDFTVKAS